MKKPGTGTIALLVMLLAALSAITVFADDLENFKAKLKGKYEVPAVSTKAKGEAEFELTESGDAFQYKLKVEKIENVVAAHIHMGAPGSNGPVVVWLYGPIAPGGGPIKGTIAEGTVTSADFVGPLAGQPISALIDMIASGNAYVNVHTNDGIAPAGTGPGDIPSGEIRGHLH